MRRAAIILFFILLTLYSGAQNLRDTVWFISEIKRDSLFVYGDATMPSEAEARNQALRLLLREIPAGARLDTTLVSYLLHRRGEMTRAFAYVARTELQSAQPERVADTGQQVRFLEEILRTARDVAELESCLLEHGHEGIRIETLEENTSGKDLEESYILVCLGSKIQAVFSPVGSGHLRRRLQTGEMTNRIMYKKGDIIRWVHIDTF